MREIKQGLETLKEQGIVDLVDTNRKWNDYEIEVKGSKSLKEPTVDTGGIDKSLVSIHYDLIIADDLVNRETVNTREQIQKTIKYFQDLQDLGKDDTLFLVIGTRWDYSDLYGHIINNLKKEFITLILGCYDDKGGPVFPEKFSKKKLENLRKTKGEYEFNCNPYEAPLLMGDFTTKPIGEVKQGDEIIGFTRGTSKQETKLVKARVLKTFSREAYTQKMTMASGRVIECTPEHNWYTGRYDKTHRLYKPAKKGSTLVEVINTDKRKIDKDAWRYLGGMIDGEGACKYGTISVSQDPVKNKEVYEGIKGTLDKTHIDYTQYRDNYTLNGGLQCKFDIIRYAKPFKKDQIAQNILNASSRYGTKDKVVKIEKGAKRRVYALTTTTGNYIVWGYCSKNCQYLNNPIDSQSAKFRISKVKYYEPDTLKDKLLNSFITIDRAYSMERLADYTGIVVVSVDVNNNWYIREALRFKDTEKKLIDKLFDLSTLYDTLDIGIEQNAFKYTFKPHIDDEMRRRNKFLSIKELKPMGRNKERRIEGLIPRWENGTIYLLPEHDALIYELTHFPKSEHDDVLDALAYQLELSHAPNGGKRNQWGEVDKMKQYDNNFISY